MRRKRLRASGLARRGSLVPDWLRVDEEGRVVADRPAQRRLALRAGRYQLAATPAGLLVALAESDAELPLAGPMVLAGDLSRVGFPDLVSLLSQSRASGLLRIDTAAARRTLMFVDGELRGAASSREGERLGEVAVQMGLIEPQQMTEMVAEADGERRHGRVAVERGLVSERELWNAMQEQMTAIFQGIMLETAGSFALCEGAIDDAVTVPGLPAGMLLVEATRRIDEMRRQSGGDVRARLEFAVGVFNEAFRDIFATASAVGVGEAVARAAASAFAEETGLAACFRGLEFTDEGELPAASVLAQLLAAAPGSEEEPEPLLVGVLAKAALFLLFVAGEHLDTPVHEALHTRVKAAIAKAS